MNKPKNIDYCEQHYIPPDNKYIICHKFGCHESMSDACWWCKEMTRYQWEMCWDETHIQRLLSPIASVLGNNRKKTRAEAIEYIEEYKQRMYKKKEDKKST